MTRTSVRPGAGGWFVVAFSDRLDPSVRLVRASAIDDAGGVIDAEDA